MSKKEKYKESQKNILGDIEDFKQNEIPRRLLNCNLLTHMHIQNEYIIEMLEKQKGEGNE